MGVETITKNDPVVEKSDIVFISVKPQVVPSVLSEIKTKSADKLFISVAMGITLNTLEQVKMQCLTKIKNQNNVQFTKHLWKSYRLNTQI